jgi:hypothetical protein
MRLRALLLVASAWCATLKVGPGQRFSTPCQAFRAATAGDTVEIDSRGDYSGDVCGIWKPDLIIRGVGPGRPHLRAAGNDHDGKGIWVFYPPAANPTVENIEFSGAAVPDRNGAAIRLEPGVGLTLRRCLIHHCQTGLLTGNAPNSDIVIEYSSFHDNGTGDGYSHNVYVNRVRKFVFRGNYSSRAHGGQLVKSRARETWIVANRLSQEDGTGSREIDISEGGEAYIIGNIIEQGPASQNRNLAGYAVEQLNPAYPRHQLLVLNNTFINRAPQAVFVEVRGTLPAPPQIINNLFFGAGVWCNQPGAILENNLTVTAPDIFADFSALDLHLRPAARPINQGRPHPLLPEFQYRHPACVETRPKEGAPDVGAYEFGPAASACH